VAGRQIAAGDGDEAGETRLGGQEIVVIRLQAAIGDAIADREKLAVGVQQEAEAHLVEQPPEARHQSPQPGGEISGAFCRVLRQEAAPMADNGRLQGVNPDHRLGTACGSLGIALGQGLHERGNPLRMRRQGCELRQNRLRRGGDVPDVPGQIGERCGERTVAWRDERLTQKIERVLDAGPPIRFPQRLRGQIAAGIPQGDEMPG
jgi:hypothetical protein